MQNLRRTTNPLRRAAAILCLALAPLAASAAATPAPPAASVQATPGNAAPTDPVYAVELRAYLDNIRVYQRYVDAISRDTSMPREFIKAFLAWSTADRYYARMMPVYARHIPPAHAAALGAMARKRPVPLGKQQAALQSYWAMEKQAMPEMRQVWAGLGAEFARQAEQRAYAEIRRAVAELAAHRGTEHKVTLNKVGLPQFDKMVSLSVNDILTQMNASVASENSCRQAGMDTALQPASLLAPDGVAAARHAIDGCQLAMETMEKAAEASFNQTRAGYAALDIPNKAAVLQAIESKTKETYDFMLKRGEIERQAFEAQRRLLSVVEAKRSHIHLQDGKLQFDDEDALAEYNRTVVEIAAFAKSLNDFIYQERQKSQLRNVDLHDGITAPQAPDDAAKQ